MRYEEIIKVRKKGGRREGGGGVEGNNPVAAARVILSNQNGSAVDKLFSLVYNKSPL